MKHFPIESAAVAHGVGLFETMLVRRRRALQVDEHYARMSASCEALRFPLPEPEAFRAEVDRACASAGENEAALRCVWLAGGSVDHVNAWHLAASVGDIPRVTRARRESARAITLDSSFVRSLPLHKATSYAVCVVALRQAVERDANEALFLTREGLVLEGTATNVFAVKDRTLVTAPLAAGILPGVVRAWVFSAANRLGFSIEERAPSVEELRQGAFLTSSLTTLAELRTLDGRACATAGEAFAGLREMWREDFEIA